MIKYVFFLLCTNHAHIDQEIKNFVQPKYAITSNQSFKCYVQKFHELQFHFICKWNEQIRKKGVIDFKTFQLVSFLNTVRQDGYSQLQYSNRWQINIAHCKKLIATFKTSNYKQKKSNLCRVSPSSCKNFGPPCSRSNIHTASSQIRPSLRNKPAVSKMLLPEVNISIKNKNF